MNQLRYPTRITSLSTRTLRRWGGALTNVPDSVAWIVFAAVAANMLAYVLIFSNPVIRSDAWYFLDVFVRKALDGTLSFGDFFVRRSGLDHAQPLHKLVLLISLRHFHLDFRWVAIVGWLAAMISVLLLRRLVFWHQHPKTLIHGIRTWIWAALCVSFVSLNSTSIWSWPLVTSSYYTYIFLFALLLSLWRWLESGRLCWLLACALIFDTVADDTAILANIACLLALAIAAWQNRPLLKRAFIGGVILVLCLIVVRISYAIAFTPPTIVELTAGQRLDHLATYFVTGGWWRWIIVPLASSVSYILPLEAFISGKAEAVQIVIGVALLAAHVWFWWRVLWRRPALTASAFSSIVLMLIFYALLAGIIYGRVSIFGNQYLNQPRYVLVYSINIVALLLMSASCPWEQATQPRWQPVTISVLITLFIAWQIPLSFLAWQTGHYIKHYQQKMAWQIGEMARHPQSKPKQCVPELVVCNYPAAKRNELINLLKAHHLNVFSPQIQLTTGLSPDHPPR